MQHLNNSIQLSLNPQIENRTKQDKKTRQEKDEQAIANLRERISDIDNIFDIHGRIGNGTFSTVLLASLKSEENKPKEQRRLFAIKHLIPTSHPNRILKELKCLIEIGGVNNIAGINLCLRRDESVAFVLPYLPHERFIDYFDKMDVFEVQNYLKNLLIAVKHVHSFKVIHRDIKPSNFLYNRKSREFMLVDFGLAQNMSKRSDSSSSQDKNNKKRRTSTSDNVTQGDAKRTCPDTTKSNRITNLLNESNFKMPLKQVNEILTPKGLEESTKNLDAPLTRQIKSAILGVTMTDRLLEKVEKKKNTLNGQQTNGGNNDRIMTRSSTPKYNTNRNQSSTSPSKCCCYGKNQVCNICLVKKEIPASRAGTPGYRPPEVLLKYIDQTTAVDIWAVGVIFIAILSGVYPFFKAPDDFIALAEIVTIFGDESIRRTAFHLERQITMSRKCKPLDLKRLCIRLRNRSKIDRSQIIANFHAVGKYPECSNCQQKTFDCLCSNTTYKLESCGVDIFPSSAYDLLRKLLEINPHKRITAEDALEHPFFKTNFGMY